MRKAGVQPAGLSVRSTPDAHRRSGGPASAQISMPDAPDTGRGLPMPPGNRAERHSRGGMSSHGGFGPSTHSGSRMGGGATFGRVDAHMMSLIRRLAHVDAPPYGPGGGTDWGEGSGQASDRGSGLDGMPANLIRAHRDELRQAANGSIDHMVIDVIGSLFDQILSDPKVPPQMARQIGRLQLPVLRAALGDPSFFSSRRHPVRRFVNRIASLGAAIDDFGNDDGKRFLARVRALVNDIVEGDFDQIDIYESKLGELEQFIAEIAREEVQSQGGDPVAMLGDKEAEIRLGQRYAQQLQTELKDLSGHDFVRDFLVGVWSRVLVQAETRHGADSDRFQLLRGAARDLYMSVQPKGTPQARKEFLTGLPRLMQGLNQGMDLIGWPETARKGFFGQLLPAHAESLKAPQSMSTLDWNLLARQVDGAFKVPLPKRAELPPPEAGLPVPDDAVTEPRFTAEEAARGGLIQEAQIDWNAPVDIDLSAEPPVSDQDIRISGLPAPEPVEPTGGRSLVEHVELGYPYQMHVDGEWQKVKLSHVSPGRTFFVFSRGQRHKQTISLTHRMLARLCETGRFRAFESAYLLERATARARRQLSAVSASASAWSRA